MQAAVSRQRERLADASGVQFTRNPQGLKEALVKIAAMPDGALLTSPQAEQAAHMFFAEGLNRVFATHPPLLERIRELDPRFDEREIARAAQELAKVDAMGGIEGGALASGGMLGSPVGSAGAGVVGGGAAGFGTVGGIVGTATGGAIGAAALSRPASVLRQALPLADTVGQFQTPGRAQAFVLALLLSRDPAVRQRQFALLGRSLSVANLGFVQQIAPAVDEIGPMLRLPALQQVFPSLRRVAVTQRRALAQLAAELIHADERIEVFEFCLAKLLETLLNDELEARTPHGRQSLAELTEDVRVLVGALAQLGSTNESGARAAYESGMSAVLPGGRPEYQPLTDWPRQLDGALQRLEQLNPDAKHVLIEALVRTISSDGVMTEAEAELLRTVCALLHCPLPGLPGLTIDWPVPLSPDSGMH
jgi:uncharacterized tellurite resistance protein B-like protein